MRTRLRRANRRYALGIGQIKPKVSQFGPQLTQIAHPLAHILVTPSLNTFGPIAVVVGRRRRPRKIGPTTISLASSIGIEPKIRPPRIPAIRCQAIFAASRMLYDCFTCRYDNAWASWTQFSDLGLGRPEMTIPHPL